MAKIKCISLRPCQTRTPSGKIKFYEAGEMDFFDKVPTHFAAVSSINSNQVDFDIAPESLLREDTIPVESMVEYYKERYGEDLSGQPRATIVDYLIHSRHNPSESLAAVNAPAKAAREFKGKKGDKHDGGIGLQFADEPVKIPTPPAEEGSNDSLDDLLNGGA